MRRTRLLAAVITIFGFGVVAYGGYLATSGPRPAHGRRAIAVVDALGAPGHPLTVSVPAAAGGHFSAALQSAAKPYELAGPVNVVVVDSDPPIVYDANGSSRKEWPAVVVGGALVALFGRYAARLASKWQRQVLAAIDAGLSSYDVTARRRRVRGSQGRVSPWVADVWQDGEQIGGVLLGTNARAVPTGEPVRARLWLSTENDRVVVLDTGAKLVWQRDPVRNLIGWLAPERLSLRR